LYQKSKKNFTIILLSIEINCAKRGYVIWCVDCWWWCCWIEYSH